MKTLYLSNGEYGWELFQYENLNDLKNKFAKRNIEIGNCAVIGDCAEINRTLFLIGSQHTVSYWGENRIQIGCLGYSISKWQKNFEKVGKLENYTDEQIVEYKGYIDLITQLHETWDINKEKVK